MEELEKRVAAPEWRVQEQLHIKSIIQAGSVVEIPYQDGWYRASIIKEIKGNKAILYSGEEIDITDLRLIFRYRNF